MVKQNIAGALFILIILIWMSFGVIGIYYTVTFFLNGHSNCYIVNPQCIDLTETKEIPLSVCKDGYNCNEYCKETYETNIGWVSQCVTRGDVPDCINYQACVCGQPTLDK